MPIEVVVIPPDQRDPRWWEHSDVRILWEVRRDLSTPVVSAKGRIVLEEWDDDGELTEIEVGEIQVAKAALGDFDVVLEMDALSGDHCTLASQLFDTGFYSEDFGEWFEEQFQIFPLGDPVFIMDLKLSPEHRDEDGKAAAHAVLEAGMIFGGATSPIVTFHEVLVAESSREMFRGQGLWSWIEPLRAQRFNDVYVAARPTD